MIKEEFYYRKYLSADFIALEEEAPLLPVRLKSPYILRDEYFDFEKKVWLPLDSCEKPDGYFAEFTELSFVPKRLSHTAFLYSRDLDRKEMAQLLEYRYYKKREAYNLKRFCDCNKIEKDYVKIKITTDTEKLTLKVTITKFLRDKKAEPDFQTQIPVFEEKTLFYDMKNGLMDFASFQNKKNEEPTESVKHQLDSIQDKLPYLTIKLTFEKLLELAEQFTGVSFAQLCEQYKSQKVSLYQLYKITMLPLCPQLYEVTSCDEMKNRHPHFYYKRTDTKVFKHFCRKYRIRNTKTLRKCFLERPEVLVIYLYLKDAGFRDINLYNRVITSDENSRMIKRCDPRNLAFFCQYSIKKRGQKATMNTILRKQKESEYQPDYYLYDGLNMFAKYFKHISDTLKNDILTDGFTEFNHDALANIAYRYENKNISFTYTDEQKELEDDIDGYSFRLPDNSYQLCDIGNTLHNCVASYSDSVKDKRCTIVYVLKDGKYKICIEVRDKRIIQELVDHNKDPDHEEKKILEKWHQRHGLTQ